MILDKNTMFADDLAYNGAPTVLDLGVFSKGPGNMIKCFFQGHSLTEAAGGNITGINILSEEADSSPDVAIMNVAFALAQANKGVEFDLPSHLARYVTIAFSGTGPSGGTYSCGVIMPGNQTSQ